MTYTTPLLSLLTVLAAAALAAPHGILSAFTPPVLFMLLSGFLCGLWAWPWALGKRDVFSPTGLFGAFGLIFFMLAPMLQLRWNWWDTVPSMAENIPFISLWAGLNALGLAALALWLRRPFPPAAPLPLRTPRSLPFALALGAGLLLGLAGFAAVLWHFHGLSGLLHSHDVRLQLGRSAYDPTKGLGVPMLLADNVRTLTAIALVWAFKNKPWAKSFWALPALLAVLLPISLLIGSGLMGSRSSVVFTLFWAVGLYHLFVKPLSRPMMLAGLLGALAFMNIYQFYKFAGVEGVLHIASPTYRQNVAAKRSNATPYTVCRDLSRMDIQSYALEEYLTNPHITYSFGRSYLAAPFAVVPHALLHHQPPPLTLEKTNLVLGQGSYAPDTFTSLLIGQAGELFLNFGIPGFLAFFALLGAYLRTVTRFAARLNPQDIRRLFLPMLALLPLHFLIADSNVLVMFATRTFLLPALVVAAALWLSRLPRFQKS